MPQIFTENDDMTNDMAHALLGRKAHFDDVCALPLVRRVGALLDRDLNLKDGDVLPRGWQAILFTSFAPQSALGKDGVPQQASLVPNPDPAIWPRKVFGGRRTEFFGDLHIGSRVTRESEIVGAKEKKAGNGRLLIVTVRSQVFDEGTTEPVLVEEQDHIFRDADHAIAASTQSQHEQEPRTASIRQSIVVDPVMLFRYSAITFNAHRIHFDYPYTTQTEGYRGLLVTGPLPTLLMLEMIRDQLTHGPSSMIARNVRPLYCNEKVTLCATTQSEGWTLWAENEAGEVAVSVSLK